MDGLIPVHDLLDLEDWLQTNTLFCVEPLPLGFIGFSASCAAVSKSLFRLTHEGSGLVLLDMSASFSGGGYLEEGNYNRFVGYF